MGKLKKNERVLTVSPLFGIFFLRHNILNSKHCFYVFIPIYASKHL